MLGALARSILNPAPSSRVATQITRWRVLSWSIATLGHHAKSKILQVEYANGFILEADGVNTSEYEDLCSAKDFDRAFQDIILARYSLHRVGYLGPVYLG